MLTLPLKSVVKWQDTPSAFSDCFNNINGIYVDGIAFSRGTPPLLVWTYTAGVHESISDGPNVCPYSASIEKNTQRRTFSSFTGTSSGKNTTRNQLTSQTTYTNSYKSN